MFFALLSFSMVNVSKFTTYVSFNTYYMTRSTLNYLNHDWYNKEGPYYSFIMNLGRCNMKVLILLIIHPVEYVS